MILVRNSINQKLSKSEWKVEFVSLLSVLFGMSGFLLSLVPWPKELNIGTSWWMIQIILVLSLLSLYIAKLSKMYVVNFGLDGSILPVYKKLIIFKVIATMTVIVSLIAIVSKIFGI